MTIFFDAGQTAVPAVLGLPIVDNLQSARYIESSIPRQGKAPLAIASAQTIASIETLRENWQRLMIDHLK